MQHEIDANKLAALGMTQLRLQLLGQLPAGLTERDITLFFRRHGSSLTKTLAGMIDSLMPKPAPLAAESGFQALYLAMHNRRPGALDLALQLDHAIHRVRQDSWVGHLIKERAVKRAMYEVLKEEAEVERLFPIVKEHPEYAKTDQQASDDELAERRVADLRSTASSRLNPDLMPTEVNGKLVLRAVGSPFKSGLIPPTQAGFARFAATAYTDTTYSDWELSAVVREWFRREIASEYPKIDDSEWDEVLQDATVQHLLKGKRGSERDNWVERALEMALAWRWYRHSLLSAAGLRPPLGQRRPGHEILKQLQYTNTSFKVEVQVAGESGWSSNGQRFPTEAMAESAAKDLASRWMAVKSWRVEPTNDPPNVEAKS